MINVKALASQSMAAVTKKFISFRLTLVTPAVYLNYVREQVGSPVILIICQEVTQDPVMSTMQSMSRADGLNKYSGENSHRFDESKRNQRFEVWW